MKTLLEQYGIVIFVLVIIAILVSFASPVGNILTNSINNEINMIMDKNKDPIDNIDLESMYTIIFNWNDSSGKIETQYYSKGETFPVLEETPEREGYSFQGWNLGSAIDYDPNQYIYAAPDTYTISDADEHKIVFYAVWKKSTISMNFYYDKGDGKYSQFKKIEDQETSGTFIFPTEIPEKEGYTFLGWSEEDIENPYYIYSPGKSYNYENCKKDIDFYAIWKKDDIVGCAYHILYEDYPDMHYYTWEELTDPESNMFTVQDGVMKGVCVESDYDSELLNHYVLVIDDSVVMIENENENFSLCFNVYDVKIPDSVEQIGDYAFTNYSSIKNMILPDKVEYIGRGAFSNCQMLSYISIPESVTFIDSEAFQYCDLLTTINYNGTMEQWNNLVKSSSSSWKENSNITTIYCTDGNIAI